MNRIKVLEWNMNNRNTTKKLQKWVGKEIANKKPDIFCLVEWRDNAGNKEMIEEAMGQGYQIEAYDGAEYCDEEKNKKKTSNGILIGVKKELFEIVGIGNANCHQLIKSNGEWHVTEDTSMLRFNEPDWLKLVLELKSTKERIDIVGFKVRIGGKDDDVSSQQQLMFLTGNPDKDKVDKETYEKSTKVFDDLKNKQILLGDLNYSTDDDNWTNFEQKLLEAHYGRFYTPNGTSHGARTIDWIITKNVQTIETSNYNELDWSFRENNKEVYANRNVKTGYPDHAILTQEIELD